MADPREGYKTALPIDDTGEQTLFDGAMAEPVAPAEAESPPAEEVVVPPPVAPPAVPPEEHIPSWRLREEADSRRQAEARARQLEERLAQIQAQLQQQQPDKPSDFFEDPSKVTRGMIQEAMQPVIEESRRNMMYLAKMVAGNTHGADKVAEAEQSFLQAMQNGSLDPADYERVVSSPNRFDAVVQWNKRQSVLSAVGDDPNAWFEKQLEAKMADPTFQAKMLEKVQKGAAARPGTVELPPTLSRSSSGSPNGRGSGDPMSDENLFSFAMGPNSQR